MVDIGKPPSKKPVIEPVSQPKPTVEKQPSKKSQPEPKVSKPKTSKTRAPTIPKDILESLEWIIGAARSIYARKLASVQVQLDEGTRTSPPGYYRDFAKVDAWIEKIKTNDRV